MVMKSLTTLLAAVLLFAGVGVSHAVVRIKQDRGGWIAAYINIRAYAVRARW
jgi:hypothetical protein